MSNRTNNQGDTTRPVVVSKRERWRVTFIGWDTFRTSGMPLIAGTGSRLWPITRGVSKQLLPVYDKPMIYYPLSALMLAGIREVLIITTPHEQHGLHQPARRRQPVGPVHRVRRAARRPTGWPRRSSSARDFVAGERSALVLGDNIFFGHGLVELLQSRRATASSGATVFGYRVSDPERYGVAEVDAQRQGAQHRGEAGRSRAATTRSPACTSTTSRSPRSRPTSKPSPRGEYEITDVNAEYLRRGQLHMELLGRGYAWLDTGTYDSLLEASHFVATLEKRQGLQVASPDEISFAAGWIDAAQLRANAEPMGKNPYGQYLLRLAGEGIQA